MVRPAGWLLVEEGLASLMGSDGHRATRPPFLDEAYAAVRARVGEEAADDLFGGAALQRLESLAPAEPAK